MAHRRFVEGNSPEQLHVSIRTPTTDDQFLVDQLLFSKRSTMPRSPRRVFPSLNRNVSAVTPRTPPVHALPF